MSLDSDTLYAALGLTAFVLSLSMALFWRVCRGIPGVGGWTLGIGLLSLGCIGFLLRGTIPDILSIVLANGLALAGAGAIWFGTRAFHGRQSPWLAGIATLGLFLILMALFTYVRPDMRFRIIIADNLMAGAFLLAAWEMARGRWRMLKGQEWTATLSLALMGTALVIPAARLLLVRGSTPAANATGTPPEVLLVVMALTVVFVFSVVLLATMRLSQQLRGTLQAGERERLRAEQANRAKSEFLAMMSHEFRTPLNTIVGLSDLGRTIGRGKHEIERADEYFGLIHESADHLLQLVNDILDLAKLEIGRLEARLAPVELGRVLRSTLRLVGERAESRGQTLTLDLPDPMPRCVADERVLRQILLNLLSNALKFTHAGGKVRLSAAARPGGVEILVEDDGPGIPEDRISQLIRPFEQLDKRYNVAREGTGLGLPMVDALVRLQGGRFRLSNRPSGGIAASVFLPDRPDVPPCGALPTRDLVRAAFA